MKLILLVFDDLSSTEYVEDGSRVSSALELGMLTKQEKDRIQ